MATSVWPGASEPTEPKPDVPEPAEGAVGDEGEEGEVGDEGVEGDDGTELGYGVGSVSLFHWTLLRMIGVDFATLK